jgi:hypothetical protein
VVIVAMAEHDSVKGIKLDTKSYGIPQDHVALAGVEQSATAVRLDQEGQSVFGQKAPCVHRILDQRRHTELLDHACPPA